MSIADKLIYLNTTKDKLKESINNIGGSITDETTFRAYATELDNIYSNLPKTTGEGSNLSLTTLKGRINVDDILGDTTQEGTPTPSSPQDINVVTGEQQVLVRGKNLFDGILELGLINGNTGLDQPNSTIIRDKNYIQVEGNTQYVISTPNSTIASDSVLIYEYKADYSYNLTTNIGVAFGTAWTTKADTKYIRFRPRYATTDTTIKFMVEKGTTASAWQPYQEQTKIVNLSSKNILNITSLQQGIIGTTTLTYENDILTLKSGAYGSNFANLETKTLKANTQYIYELFLDETSTNSAKVSLIVQKEGSTNIINSGQITFGDQTYYSFTYTPTEDTKILRLQFYNSSTTPITADISFKVQLREASSESGYMPYYNYELCKIGTYQDRISKSSGKNLFSGFIKGKGISASTGVETTNTNAGVSDYIPVNFDLNSNYYISGLTNTLNSLVGAYNSNKEFLGRTGATTTTTWNLTKNSFTNATQGTGDVAYIRVEQYYLSGSTGTIDDIDKLNVMLNEGSTALPYEPYGTNWYIEKNIGKYLGKDLTWNYYSVTQGSLFRSGTLDIKKASSGFSNYYTCKTMDTRTNPSFYINNDNPYIDVIDSNYTNATTFKTWLTNNNVMFYVPLNTATYEEITNTTLIEQLNNLEKMMSYNGQTNISVSGNLPMILGVTALKGE